jgi:hypothetical protein
LFTDLFKKAPAYAGALVFSWFDLDEPLFNAE